MRKLLFISFFIGAILCSYAQELNCLVTVNSDQIPGSNKQIFKTLEKSISEFLNQKNGLLKVLDHKRGSIAR